MCGMATEPLGEPFTAYYRPLWPGRAGATKTYSSGLWTLLSMARLAWAGDSCVSLGLRNLKDCGDVTTIFLARR